MTDQRPRSWMSTALGWLVQIRLPLLFLILIALQALTWRAVVSVQEEVENARRAINQNACGGSGTYDSPCRVTIVGR